MSIQSIQVVTAQGAGTKYEVGKTPDGFINPVGMIKDCCIEWEDHIDWRFDIYDEIGMTMAELINCPVEVKYAKAEGRQPE